MNTPLKAFIMLVLVGLGAGCANDNEEDLYPEVVVCDTSAVTLSGTVQPILAQNCNGCHAQANASGGVILDSYAEVKKQADNGRLVGAVSHSPGFHPMPLGGAKLPACDIASIKKWVENGAPNN
jgi:mono/diheme cytochrome c family protein